MDVDKGTLVDMPRKGERQPLEARLARYSKLNLVTGCIEWTGATNKAGYGQIKVAGKQLGAHVVAYEVYVGPVEDGMTIDHTCLNVACIHSEHLEQVTQQVNILRGPTTLAGRNARKTHCPHGHRYTRANTYRHPRDGRRFCRQCQRIRQRVEP
jgi:HNH endonuclease